MSGPSGQTCPLAWGSDTMPQTPTIARGMAWSRDSTAGPLNTCGLVLTPAKGPVRPQSHAHGGHSYLPSRADLCVSPRECLHGSPREFLDAQNLPCSEFLQDMIDFMANSTHPPACHHTFNPAQTTSDPSLWTSTFMFSHCDKHNPPLHTFYDGPYVVMFGVRRLGWV